MESMGDQGNFNERMNSRRRLEAKKGMKEGVEMRRQKL